MGPTSANLSIPGALARNLRAGMQGAHLGDRTVPTRRQTSLGNRAKGALLAAIAAAAVVLSAAPAPAQGIFDRFFNRPASPSAPAYSNPFADFFGLRPEPPKQEMGGGVAYCVRTCDGRYFPIQRVAGADAAQQCNAICPASKTSIYSSSSSIELAVGPDGKRYSELNTAFVYRERIVPACTCNGKDAFGVVTPPVQNDPTLRPGDIVATNNGLMAYNGVDGRRNAQFTPIDARGLSAELRQKLADTKVDPAVATPAPVQAGPKNQGDGAPVARTGRNKRVQNSR